MDGIKLVRASDVVVGAPKVATAADALKDADALVAIVPRAFVNAPAHHVVHRGSARVLCVPTRMSWHELVDRRIPLSPLYARRVGGPVAFACASTGAWRGVAPAHLRAATTAPPQPPRDTKPTDTPRSRRAARPYRRDGSRRTKRHA